LGDLSIESHLVMESACTLLYTSSKIRYVDTSVYEYMIHASVLCIMYQLILKPLWFVRMEDRFVTRLLWILGDVSIESHLVMVYFPQDIRNTFKANEILKKKLFYQIICMCILTGNRYDYIHHVYIFWHPCYFISCRIIFSILGFCVINNSLS
jgi:hypothetical protein